MYARCGRRLAVLVCALLVGTVAAQDHRFENVAAGLVHPWSLAFLPNGDMLVTEREGRLRIVRGGALDSRPVAGVPEVYVRSQAGLFDVVLHPRFAENGILYLSYAHGTRRRNAMRVARARFDGQALHEVTVIFEVVPSKATPVHYGGRMLFLPDGTLLVTTGDGFDYREQAQDLGSLLGKTVRLNDDGSIPPDNPFVDHPGARAEIWTYGHRNPQGLAFDAETARVYLHDHGPRGGDELNVLQAGRNYGWPLITYGVDYSGARITPFTEMQGLEQPLHYWVPSIAPSGMTLYDGTRFPELRGRLLIGALADRAVHPINVLNGTVTRYNPLFAELGARIRDVRTGPDGLIYLLTDEPRGRVIRVLPRH